MASPSIDAMLVMSLAEREQIAERFWRQGEYRRAKKQYRILARLGSKEAQSRLAWMNMNGRGMPRDEVQAWVWAALAAEFNKPPYAEQRDEYWKELNLDQREEAVQQLQKDMMIFMDHRIAQHIEIKARRKLRMDTIGYGLLAEGLVKTWRAEGMIGDPANAGGLVNLLRNIQYISKQHVEGQRVELGEFEVLEDQTLPPFRPAADSAKTEESSDQTDSE